MKKNRHLQHKRSWWHILLGGLFVLVVGVMSVQTLKITLAQPKNIGEFHGQAFLVPLPPTPKDITNVLGDSTNKRIEVDLTNQKVYALEGDSRIYDFTVSTGLWGRTPVGDFTIQRKVTSQTMAGGNRAIGTYYYLPGVPWVQFFGNAQIPWSRGFSFHGTYWHNNFGHPMSHGCINMKTPDAEVLFAWAPMGTPVKIYGQPRE